jgi:hypothetical protein
MDRRQTPSTLSHVVRYRATGNQSFADSSRRRMANMDRTYGFPHGLSLSLPLSLSLSLSLSLCVCVVYRAWASLRCESFSATLNPQACFALTS